MNLLKVYFGVGAEYENANSVDDRTLEDFLKGKIELSTAVITPPDQIKDRKLTDIGSFAIVNQLMMLPGSNKKVLDTIDQQCSERIDVVTNSVSTLNPSTGVYTVDIVMNSGNNPGSYTVRGFCNDNNLNKINPFLSKNNNVRIKVEYNIKASSLIDSILKINSYNTTITNFVDSFNNQDNIFEIFNKKNNKINHELIIVNNTFLGEMNADDFISINFPNTINLNRQINTESFDINNVKSQRVNHKDTVKKFIKDYYSDEHAAFKNSATFFQEIKNLCSKNFKWHLSKKNKMSVRVIL